MDGPRLLPLTINESDFVSLSPGESWTDRIPLDDDELAESFQVGEKYSYQFIGTFVQWWDWGTLKVCVLHDAFGSVTRAAIDYHRITSTRASGRTRQATMSDPRSSYQHQTRLNSW